MARKPRELFLSHASEDRPLADALAATLRAHGVRVWYSTTNLQGAQQWHDEIGRALRRCDWFVVLLTPAAVRSLWVKRELLFALGARSYENRIAPLVARSCRWERLSWTLGNIQFENLSPYESGCRRLLALWRIPLDPLRVTKPNLRRKRAAARKHR